MKVKSVSFEDKNYQFFENDSDELENLFTILVGRNGSGKSRILQKICFLYLNSLRSDNNQNFAIESFTDSYRYKNINDTSHLNYGKINYQINGNEFEINIHKINGINTFYTNSVIIEKKNKTPNINKFIDIKKLLPFQPVHLISSQFQTGTSTLQGITHLKKNIYIEEQK